MNKFLVRFLSVAAIGGAFASSAHAAIDTTAATAALTDAGTAAGVIGAASLVVIVGIKAFKMMRQAL